MKHYSVPQINELQSNEKTWKNLVCIVLSESFQYEKATCYVIPTFAKHDDSKKISGCQGLRRRDGRYAEHR
jgi:hypothetical protein